MEEGEAFTDFTFAVKDSGIHLLPSQPELFDRYRFPLTNRANFLNGEIANFANEATAFPLSRLGISKIGSRSFHFQIPRGLSLIIFLTFESVSVFTPKGN